MLVGLWVSTRGSALGDTPGSGKTFCGPCHVAIDVHVITHACVPKLQHTNLISSTLHHWEGVASAISVHSVTAQRPSIDLAITPFACAQLRMADAYEMSDARACIMGHPCLWILDPCISIFGYISIQICTAREFERIRMYAAARTCLQRRRRSSGLGP